MRPLIPVMLLTIGPWCASAMSQDDSVRGYKVPPIPSISAISAPVSPSPRAPVAPSDVLPARLPDRVTLEFGNGYVSRHGAVCDFVLADAAMPEVMAALGRTFDVGVTYSGRSDREISGRYSGRTAAEVLLRLVDRTDLRFYNDGTAWGVEEMGRESLPSVSLGTVGKAEPVSSGATAGR
jgi:hypothetical protein